MTTQTTVGGQAGYTFSSAYDSTTGTVDGMSNTTTGAPTLASLSYNAQAQISAVTLNDSNDSPLASEQLTYDADLRPLSTTTTWQNGGGGHGGHDYWDAAFTKAEESGSVEGSTPPDDIITNNKNDTEVVINPNKYNYLFGRATGSEHNIERTAQLALDMKWLGVSDNQEGYTLLDDHLKAVGQDPTNVIEQSIDEWGRTIFRKQSLFAGPSGKFALFESRWWADEPGKLNFGTLIAKYTRWWKG